MNTGQIVMSMMQSSTKPVLPDAILIGVTQNGEQKQVDVGFADLLGVIEVQAKAMTAVDADPAGVSSLSEKSGLPTEFPALSTASELLGTLQAEAHQFPKISQVQDEVAAPEAESDDVSDEDSFTGGILSNLEMNTAVAQMVLEAYAQPARMPIANTTPSHEADSVENVPAAPVINMAYGREAFQSADGSLPSPVVRPEQQLSQPATPATVEAATEVVETPVLSQPTTVSASAINPKPELKQSAEPIQQVLLKTVEASEPDQSSPLQQTGRIPAVNIQFSHEVDTVQNVSAAPKAEQPSVPSATAPKTQVVEPVQSMPQPITPQSIAEIKVIHVSEQQQVLQSDPIINPASGREVPQPADGSLPLSAERPEASRTPAAVMSENPEADLNQKKQPEIAMAGTATGTPVLQPETINLVKGTADNRSASLQQAVRNVPAQLAPDVRSENVRPSSTLSVTKENMVSQQNIVTAGEAALTSDDSMNSGQDQTWSGQTSDNQLTTPMVHVQSKPEHQAVGSVQNSKVNAEQPRQDLPEQVAHQVRERLTQHEVKPGNQQITLTLSPENLGELKMNLNLQGQRLSVEIVTENRAVRDAIMQHSESLKESLARQNISIESFDVTTGGKGSGNQGQNQNAWRELAKQQQNWATPHGYNTARADVPPGKTAYQSQQGHSTLDIHY
ncbi:MAG: flagellar hook-length control protein FliK [Steroidobacteraceae bacterium]|nr:flagellar hook-length control protein FliK [Deltaproteobacteria bacterium]